MTPDRDDDPPSRQPRVDEGSVPPGRSHTAWTHRTVLFLDIFESSRLAAENERGFLERWLNFSDWARTEMLPAHRGRYIKGTGDGFIAEFDDGASAVSAALTIQEEAARRNDSRPPRDHILMRIGVAAGDFIVTANDIHGKSLNEAARLCDFAEPGEIVVSVEVGDQITPSLDAEIEDLGSRFAKNIGMLRSYRVGPPAPKPEGFFSLTEADLLPAIAVLPFEPKFGGPGTIGNALSEETIRAISRSQTVRVISHLSTVAFRGRSVGLDEVRYRLGAQYVLSGRFETEGDQVALDVQFTDTSSGAVIWVRRLEGSLSEFLRGDQEMIAELVGWMGNAIMTGDVQRVSAMPIASLETRTLLMAGIALMHRQSPDTFREALPLLEEVVRRAPRLAIPRAWLAKWHVLNVQQGWAEDQATEGTEALAETHRALDLEPDCSLALVVHGFVQANVLKRLDIARESYDLAIEHNPNDSLAWLMRGTLDAFVDKGVEGVRQTALARRLSPLDPHRYFYDSLSATAHLSAGQDEEAIALARRSLRLNHQHTSTLRVLTIAQWRSGQHDDARETAKLLLELQPKLTVSGYLAGHPAAAYETGRDWADALGKAGIPQ